MKNWGIFTVIYALITAWLTSKAGDNMFGPDIEGTILIASILYGVLFIIFLAVKKNRGRNHNQ